MSERRDSISNVAADLQKASELDAEAATPQASLPHESQVLVIYTGGTIGMINDPVRGYIPVPNLLYDNLREQARFNDPNGHSVLNASSLRDYQNWRSDQWEHKASLSKQYSTTLPSTSARGPCRNINTQEVTLPVRTLSADNQVVTKQFSSLVTPRFHTGRTVRYVIFEYEKLIDSSDIDMLDWIKIATDIELNYEQFDSFVVLHGTDTLSYTASALSFLLENLNKTVIITGAQIPITYLRNDAVSNLLDSLTLAGINRIPEVGLYFCDKLYRGTRTIKSSSFDFDAFQSPNIPPLAKMGINVEINWSEVLEVDNSKTLKVHKNMSRDVAVVRMFPGISTAAIKASLATPMKGIILETFGAGNIPQRNDLLQVLKEASERGVIIVNVTQCAKGAVVGLYESGKRLRDAGVISGHDMTTEAALTKLSYLLGTELSVVEIRKLMTKSIRGELKTYGM